MKTIKKYELWILGNNEIFIYQGQKYKKQTSKKEHEPSNTCRCIKIDGKNNYIETVFLY